MKNKILVTLALCVTLFALVACSAVNADNSANQTPATQEVSIQFDRDQHIQKQLEVASGDQIQLTLPSNGTTGFSWDENATIANTAILQQTQHEYIGANSDVLGAAGSEQWTFKALKAGTTLVHLDYSRPWTGGEKGVQTLDLTVSVK